ncbi:hypothetical protein K456DRAFT_1180982 [Colletotrichum gloeosporioides 23]|nr:hypothetical protein K456DRAFT_1180982 [Colletotrichum gloeosporioides 23]
MESVIADEMVPDPALTAVGMDTETFDYRPSFDALSTETYKVDSMLPSMAPQPWTLPSYEWSSPLTPKWPKEPRAGDMSDLFRDSQDLNDEVHNTGPTLTSPFLASASPFMISRFFVKHNGEPSEVYRDGCAWEARTHTTSHFGTEEEKVFPLSRYVVEDTSVAVKSFRESDDSAYTTGFNARKALHGSRADLWRFRCFCHMNRKGEVRRLPRKMVDPGLARLPSKSRPRTYAKRTPRDGTICCRSPELGVRGGQHASPPMCIWSFGRLLLEKLALFTSRISASTAIAYVKPGVLAYYGTWMKDCANCPTG